MRAGGGTAAILVWLRWQSSTGHAIDLLSESVTGGFVRGPIVFSL